MKRLLLIFIISVVCKSLFAQTIPTSGCEIVYTYDAVGNRTERAYYCNGGIAARVDKNKLINKDTMANANPNNIKVEALYPNPNNGKFTIYLNYELKNAVVILRDVTGKTVQHFKANGSKILFDISEQAVGTYFLSIFASETLILTEKVIKTL